MRRKVLQNKKCVRHQGDGGIKLKGSEQRLHKRSKILLHEVVKCANGQSGVKGRTFVQQEARAGDHELLQIERNALKGESDVAVVALDFFKKCCIQCVALIFC